MSSLKISQLVTREDESDDYERIVYGEVYIPNRVDTYGTAMTPEEVRRVAHDFMRRVLVYGIDIMHDEVPSGCYVVESYIAKANDPDGFIEGAWVMGVQVIGDELWEQIRSGYYNGFSISGYSSREKTLVTLIHIKEIELITEDSTDGLLPPHSHTLHLIFTDDGVLIPTYTADALGHYHPVWGATATEFDNQGLGHAHRFVVVE